MINKLKPPLDSNLDDHLKDEGTLEDMQKPAAMEVIVWERGSSTGRCFAR